MRKCLNLNAALQPTCYGGLPCQLPWACDARYETTITISHETGVESISGGGLVRHKRCDSDFSMNEALHRTGLLQR